MKKFSLLTIALAFLVVGCSTEDQPTTTNDVANLELTVADQDFETGQTRAGGPDRVSITGNQSIRMQARLNSNGAASGFWVDNNPNGGVGKVNVECIYFFDDGQGASAILTGTGTGQFEGLPFAIRVRDCQADAASMTAFSNGMPCPNQQGNPQLFPIEINGGNVKIN